MGPESATSPLAQDTAGNDDFVHIVFDDTPHKALCGKDVEDYLMCGPEAGPECVVCSEMARWWESIQP